MKFSAAKLRGLRAQKGLKQLDVAELAGLSVNTIGLLETGAHDELRTGTAAKIAGALGVHWSELFDDVADDGR